MIYSLRFQAMVEIVFSTITCLKITDVYAKIKSVRYRNKFIKDKNITEGKMFDMNQVGANICKFRKSIGITQMDLADKLGISFQAVSNWERGISMPDISKLNELSVLFDISIDEILGNERACTVIKNLLNDKPTDDISIEEISEIAPILHEDEVESLIKDKDGISIEEFSKLAPFLSQEYIDKIAKEILKENGTLKSCNSLLAFVSSEIIDEAASEIFKRTGEVGELQYLAPFMSKKLIWEISDISYKTKNIASLSPIAPFIDEEKMNEYALTDYSVNGINSLVPVAPFISSDLLNRLTKETLEKKGLIGIVPIMPFVSHKIVEDYIDKEGIK